MWLYCFRKNKLNKIVKAVHYKIRDHVSGECSYATSGKSALMRHAKVVQDKIRDHACGECDNATSQKYELKKHMLSIQKVGDKKVKGYQVILSCVEVPNIINMYCSLI